MPASPGMKYADSKSIECSASPMIAVSFESISFSGATKLPQGIIAYQSNFDPFDLQR